MLLTVLLTVLLPDNIVPLNEDDTSNRDEDKSGAEDELLEEASLRPLSDHLAGRAAPIWLNEEPYVADRSRAQAASKSCRRASVPG